MRLKIQISSSDNMELNFKTIQFNLNYIFRYTIFHIIFVWNFWNPLHLSFLSKKDRLWRICVIGYDGNVFGNTCNTCCWTYVGIRHRVLCKFSEDAQDTCLFMFATSRIELSSRWICPKSGKKLQHGSLAKTNDESMFFWTESMLFITWVTRFEPMNY